MRARRRPRCNRSKAGWRAPALLAIASALLALPVSAGAALVAVPGRVVVVLRPPVADEVTADALSRVQGELTAAGFDVRVIARDPALPIRLALESSGRELAPIATFAIVRPEGSAEGGDTAEIWVSDRVAGRSVIQTVRLPTEGLEVDPKRKAIVLAVRAVELLKASLADYWIEPVPTRVEAPRTPAPAPPLPPTAQAPEASPPPMLRHGLAVQAAVGWLDNVGTVRPVWQPVLRAAYLGARGWGGRVTVAGLGGETQVAADAQTARIGQTLAALELLRSFAPARRLRLSAGLGAGAYVMQVEGMAVGAIPHEGSVWSLLSIAGAGAAIAVAPHLAVAVEAHTFLTWPRTTVRLADVESGRTGWPALLISAGVMGTF